MFFSILASAGISNPARPYREKTHQERHIPYFDFFELRGWRSVISQGNTENRRKYLYLLRIYENKNDNLYKSEAQEII